MGANEMGMVKTNIALILWSLQPQQSEQKGFTNDYEKFKDNSGLIYANEVFFNMSYVMDSGALYPFMPLPQMMSIYYWDYG